MQNDLMTTKQVAEHLRKSEATITRWAIAGKLQPVHKGEGLRGAYLFNRSDIEQLAGTPA